MTKEAPAAAPTPPRERLIYSAAELRAAIQKAVDQNEEECCKAVCRYCEIGNVPRLRLGAWAHCAEWPKKTDEIIARCDASPIRARGRRG